MEEGESNGVARKSVRGMVNLVFVAFPHSIYNPEMRDRAKPSIAFWITSVVLASPVVYLLSFGPACWLASCGSLVSDSAVVRLYAPIIREARRGPACLHDAVACYAELGAQDMDPGQPHYFWLERYFDADVQDFNPRVRGGVI